ncbi:MAG: hydroxymethylbilane synthase [Solirubrobacterales bacterium]
MTLRIGTRGSALALAQAQSVARLLGDAELVAIRTSGDEATGPAEMAAPADRAGPPEDDKSRFVKEIEEALLAERVDVAVHSAKDLSAVLPDGLEIAAVPAREDAADAFVGEAHSLAGIAEGARVGTSSLRRRSQLLAGRSDLDLVDLRGNVDTRLRRVGAGEFEGIVVAAAGLVRLQRDDEIAFRFATADVVPAAGQGALAIETRVGDAAAAEKLAPLNDPEAATELAAERAVVATLEATCNTPIGVRASLTAAGLSIDSYVGLPDGSEWVRDRLEGDPEDPAALGREAGSRLAAAGALEILERAEQVVA